MAFKSAPRELEIILNRLVYQFFICIACVLLVDTEYHAIAICILATILNLAIGDLISEVRNMRNTR